MPSRYMGGFSCGTWWSRPLSLSHLLAYRKFSCLTHHCRFYRSPYQASTLAATLSSPLAPRFEDGTFRSRWLAAYLIATIPLQESSGVFPLPLKNFKMYTKWLVSAILCSLAPPVLATVNSPFFRPANATAGKDVRQLYKWTGS